MNEAETAWVAGIMEGEGCFTIRRAPASKIKLLQVYCGMSDEDVIRKLHSIVGFGSVHTTNRTDPARASHKTIYAWNCAKRSVVIPFLEAIRPHMGARRTAKIDEMLQYALDNPPYSPAPYECGTTRTYKQGCRCDLCREANTEYCRNLKQGIKSVGNRLPRA